MRQVRRRQFLIITAALFAAPCAAPAQQTRRSFRVGFLGMSNRENAQPLLDALWQGLREHGWIEGQTLTIEYRWAKGRVERLPDLAAELVDLKVDVLMVSPAAGIRAARDATRTIPIVMMSGGDPVAEGFVASLSQPAGNITGLTFHPGPEIAGKLLELLMQAIPKATQLAVLSNPTNPPHVALLKETRTAGSRLGVNVRFWEARHPEEIDSAFVAMTKDRISAVLVLPDAMFAGQRGRLADLAAKNRLPAIYGQTEHVSAGGLMAYSVNLADNYKRAASFVDRILKGANPGTLPIERPTRLQLAINLKTARGLGLTIPQSLILRADQVIE